MKTNANFGIILVKQATDIQNSYPKIREVSNFKSIRRVYLNSSDKSLVTKKKNF